MHQIAYNQNGLQETGGAYSAAELLAALTPEDYQRLVGFARYRLRTVVTARWLQRHLADTDAEDLVAEALLKIQLGEQDSRLGRRLKPENRATTASFLVGVKGVINSDLSHLLDSARNRCEHLSIGEPETEPGAVNPPDPTDPGRLLLRRDLHRVLFSQLYARAAEQPRLLAVIKEWDQNFLSDNRIARDGHSRKIIYRVRQLAREILRDLEAELSLVTNEGREMLL
jgi:hypothetical protein